MATDSNTGGANTPDPLLASIRAKVEAAKHQPAPNLPTSKPLQVFLLIALVITGTAYAVDEWMAISPEQSTVKHTSKLRRLVENQNVFLTETALGQQAEAKKKYDDAVLHFRRALIGQVNTEGRLNLGNALLKEGNPDMAFSQFKVALTEDPNAESVYVAWGQALAFQGKTDEAVQMYQDALRHNPKFAEVHFNFALVLGQQQQIQLAARHAAALANQPADAAKDAAEAQFDGQDALKHYLAAEKLGLNAPDFWTSYGTVLNRAGQFTQAEDCLNKAVAARPGSGPAQFQLASALDRQGKYGEAIGHYEATLAAIPDDPDALNNLALIYATAKNEQVRSSKMAVQLATRANDATTSQNARYLDTLARAYASDNDFFQAIAWEDKAMRRAKQIGDTDLLQELQPRFNLFVQHKTE